MKFKIILSNGKHTLSDIKSWDAALSKASEIAALTGGTIHAILRLGSDEKPIHPNAKGWEIEND